MLCIACSAFHGLSELLGIYRENAEVANQFLQKMLFPWYARINKR